MIKSPRKNVADLAGIKPATCWSPVGCASNSATEADMDLCVLHISYKPSYTFWLAKATDEEKITNNVIKKSVLFFYFYCQNLAPDKQDKNKVNNNNKDQYQNTIIFQTVVYWNFYPACKMLKVSDKYRNNEESSVPWT